MISRWFKLFIVSGFAFGFSLAWSAELGNQLGWDNGNAGDAFSAEFILSGQDILQRLRLNGVAAALSIDLGRVEHQLRTTLVSSDEHVFLRGDEVDAVNFYPDEDKIIVNRTRWREIRRPMETKARLRLVLHEYLWVSGYPDTNFVLSDQLIEPLIIKNYSPSTWWNPINPVNVINAKLVFSTEQCEIEQGRFNLSVGSETIELTSKVTCGSVYRKIVVRKFSSLLPASQGIRGLFHRFDISVYDQNSKIGGFTYEPEWGACLMPPAEGCPGSGKMIVGGVELVFLFQREPL